MLIDSNNKHYEQRLVLFCFCAAAALIFPLLLFRMLSAINGWRSVLSTGLHPVYLLYYGLASLFYLLPAAVFLGVGLFVKRRIVTLRSVDACVSLLMSSIFTLLFSSALFCFLSLQSVSIYSLGMAGIVYTLHDDSTFGITWIKWLHLFPLFIIAIVGIGGAIRE